MTIVYEEVQELIYTKIQFQGRLNIEKLKLVLQYVENRMLCCKKRSSSLLYV